MKRSSVVTSCRLCLEDFLPLQEESNIRALKDKIQTVFSFEIISHKQLSTDICPNCVRLVGQFYEYTNKVGKIQQQLYQLIESESESENEDMLIKVANQLHNMNDDSKECNIECPKIITGDPNEPNTRRAATKPREAVAKFEKNLISRYLDMVCDICKEDQYTYQKLECHFRKYHAKRCYITCCGQKLTSDALISSHLEKHMAIVRTKESAETTSWDRRVLIAFGNILEDFKKDLEGYEPLPNIELALKGDAKEQQKLYNVQDYLVQTYFVLDCEFCGMRMSNQDDRRKHFRTEHPKEKYFVSCCGQRFSPRISIMRHLNRHWKLVANGHVTSPSARTLKFQPDDEPMPNKTIWQRQLQSTYGPLMHEFRDELIEGGFIPPAELPQSKTDEQLQLLRHMQDFLIAKHSPLNCELCGMEISTYAGRREHFRIGHPKEKVYVECCGRKIFTRHNIILHLLRHRKGLPINEFSSIHCIPGSMYEKQERDDAIIEGFIPMDCEMCEYTGTSYISLRAHFQNNHREEGFFITCCNRRFKTKFHILEHIAAHRKPGALKCEHCEATFTTERMRKAHYTRKHVSEEEKFFRCEHCVESFATKNLLTLHLYKHELIMCDICGAELKRCSLRVHKQNTHKLGEDIVCHMCAKVFHSKQKFNAHYRKAHLGIRKKCKAKSRAKKRSTDVPEDSLATQYVTAHEPSIEPHLQRAKFE
ncbi:transcription factor grauzone-like [Toxorhynchites rutilus septentrionalis]|uniref:transcription factor grauzone-like n=1 Tax=Toxorhynchites rutilus septentrionalis TaxID=329112 RepID=UPI002479319E|nr:transcription factor grauzone-like [Toxorhynchites rutilus septentrionalis]